MKIGRFDIIQELGRGGMGVVYKAFDTNLERPVAIKKLTRVTEEFLERFRQEARTAGRLQHENITIIYESGDESGEPFIVMEFLDGQNLRTIMKENSIESIPRKLDVARQVLVGLDHAHAQGIAVHRDIKPANIQVLASGRVKIMDFGIAKLADEIQVARNLTQANTVLGTLYYLSPEQIRGEKLDGRSDLWSVGIVLYELLYGERPFEDPEDDGVMKKIVLEELKALRPLNWQEDEELQRILRKALEKDRTRRYATGAEFAQDLAQCIRRAEKSSAFIRPAPKSPKFYFDAGRELYNAGQYARAIEAFRKVLELKPAHKGALTNIDICERAQRTKHAEDLKRLGILLFKNREWKLSIASFEELLTMEPKDEDARTLINWARRELQKIEEHASGDLSDLASMALEGIGQSETGSHATSGASGKATSSNPASPLGATALRDLEAYSTSPPPSAVTPRERLASDEIPLESERSTSRVSAWIKRLLARS